ncbi:Clp protease N-terminal domain-containing protein [Peterkaempfera bronchialis]|uniref:Clp protease n=2 Tax=Peterkaempfera bronchialis TaxID=2126346 RepID=A0A345SRL9_9ACTN|nr:Clp protease [Peterkaempfera bronchialis]
MFERFTDDARRVVMLAQQEARSLHHPRVGTEHLLIALLDEGSGPAARVLRGHGLDPADLRGRIADPADDGLDPQALATLGIDLDQVRRATEESFGPGALDPRGHRTGRMGRTPFTDRAKKTLELSLREALRLKHRHIGTGHLLLGLLREGSGRASRLLADTGTDPDALRDETLRLITAQAA